MPKLIAANFKMNGSFSFIEEWFNAFNKEDTSSNEVIVALPAPYLGMSGNGNVKISAQNVSAKESGAYTSQISVSMIADNNVSYCIIGHSEAREYLNETNEDIKAKYDLLIENKVKPIVCIGESLETRESNETFDFITKQLEHFKNIEDEIIFAYEPMRTPETMPATRRLATNMIISETPPSAIISPHWMVAPKPTPWDAT